MNLRQSTQRWLGAPVKRSIVIASSLAAGAMMGMLVLSARPGGPFTVKLVRVESLPDSAVNAGSQSNRITLRLSNLGSNAVFFGQEQAVRFRVDHRWLEPKERLALADGYLGRGANQEAVTFLAPVRADACRLSLEYRVGQPLYCRAYFFLQQHGVSRRFPSLARFLLKCIPQQRLRHLQRELAIPVAAS